MLQPAPSAATHLRVGDVFGLHFPNCRAVWPHPAVIARIFDEPDRSHMIASKGLVEEPLKALCLAIMISHSPPPKGEFGRQLSNADIDGTLIDSARSTYVCFSQFRLVFLPGPPEEKRIMSVQNSYLGQLDAGLTAELLSNLLHIQRYIRGQDPVLDRKILRG
ncbi:hypothetical protein [Nioella sp.]|uniref:hypothetical protein n=1 Tax=Nioella sp. TaxID=1912091 RepID=UPI0035132F3E